MCTDDKSGTIRLISSPARTIVRNQVGVFAGTRVALDQTVFLSGIKAVHGHVEALQVFDPTDTSVALVQPEINNTGTTGSPSKYARISGGVIAGSKISGVSPSYPELARRMNVHGSVMLLTEISPQGAVVNLTPLSSPDARLTDAAVDAVKTWKYRPYDLNGTAVTVLATVTLNF